MKQDKEQEGLNSSPVSAGEHVPDARSILGDTGRAEVDRLIGRLTSSDPDFEDCIAAAVLLRRLVLEEINGPKGYATWKDAAVAERLARVSMRPSEAVLAMARDGLEVYSGPNMNEHKVCAEIVRLAEISNEARAALSAPSHGDQVRELLERIVKRGMRLPDETQHQHLEELRALLAKP